MGRYLVDVTCTIEVECGSPDDFDQAVEDALVDGIRDVDIRGWRVDDSFTVIEP